MTGLARHLHPDLHRRVVPLHPAPALAFPRRKPPERKAMNEVLGFLFLRLAVIGGGILLLVLLLGVVAIILKKLGR